MVRRRFKLVSMALLSAAFSPALIDPSFAEAPLPAISEVGPTVSWNSPDPRLASTELRAGLVPAASAVASAAPYADPSTPPPGRLIDYPALILLAIAIICMAALSRRDVQVDLKEGNG